MNRYQPRLIRSGSALTLAALFLAAATVAGAQARRTIRSSPQRTFVPGEIILYAYPGTPLTDVQKAAAAVQPAAITPLLLRDCYDVVLPSARQDDADTLSAIATLKTDPHVRWVGPNRLYTVMSAPPTVTPNDPMYSQQWNLPLINMPEAWVLQKGQPNHNVAWIDTGFDPKHVDAAGQFLPGSYNFGDGNSDITANGTGVDFDHGTHTSGVAIAITNNGTGIAGIDWQNIKCVGLKCVKSGTDAGALSDTYLLEAYAYVAQHHADMNIVACNMSYGAAGENPNDTTDPNYAAIKACADAGVIMIASAGNSSADDTIQVPSGYPFVVSVSAVNPKGLLTNYSSFGKVDLAAPGGEQQSDTDPNGILSLRQNNAYGFAQGTSDAAPHVTAVAALMMSAPGVTPKLAVQTMEQTANRTNVAGAVPDPKYGYGLLDAYQALLKVSVNVQILQPQGVDPTGQNTNNSGIVPPLETFKPLLTFQLGNVPPANFTITIDGNSFTWAQIAGGTAPGVSEVLPTQGNPGGDNPSYTIGFRYTFPNTAPYQHTISITGTNPASGTTSTDTRIITIQPHTLAGGLSFVSIPYYEDAQSSPTGQFRNASQLLGPNVTLFRWVNTQQTNTNGTPVVVGKYAVYGAGSSDPLAAYASFLPPDNMPTLQPPTDPITGLTITDPRPIGLAWFVQTPSPTPVITYGIDTPNQAVKIPLHEGWNMVGDPFRYQVPFNTALIQLANSGTTMSVAAAADQNLILPVLFHLVNGQYQFDTLPAGTFNPWEGHWVYVVPQNPASVQSGNTMYLIVPPTQISGNATVSAQADVKRSTPLARVMGAAGSGGWSVQLEAQTRNLADSYNYIGMSTHAKSGNDATKVPKPPQPTPYVSVGIARPNSPAGVYAQDLEPLGGVKSWDIVVSTDQSDSDVVLSWAGMAAVPRNYRLTLTDKVSGETVDMRQQASYKFHTGHPATTHSFVVTARPTVQGGRALLTDVFINPSRSAGGRAASTYQIGYTVTQDARVDVSILDVEGRMLGQISPSRAVTSGQNSVVWNGLDSTGRTLPANTYILQIRAVTASGDVTRLVHPFLITGR